MTMTSRKPRPLDRSTAPVRDARLIIIATEGRETEKQYFNSFHSLRVQVHVLPTGDDDRSSPQHVLERMQQFQQDHNLNEEDECWLMIDVDRWPPDNFGNVAKSALEQNYKLAISNPCFEVWLLCHFDTLLPTQAKKCEIIETLLRQALGGSYNKARLELDRFKAQIPQAIQTAKQNDADSTARWPQTVGTHVYKVVDSIYKLQKSYP